MKNNRDISKFVLVCMSTVYGCHGIHVKCNVCVVSICLFKIKLTTFLLVQYKRKHLRLNVCLAPVFGLFGTLVVTDFFLPVIDFSLLKRFPKKIWKTKGID